jgi:pyrrolidone-carboxylate peptidase
MKILIYGFGPYKKYKENISEKVVRKIKSKRNLVKVVFSSKFDRKMFLDKIRKVKPDIVIGLGQHTRGGKIRIERKAVNLRRDSKKEKIIFKNKPKHRFLNLKLKKDKNSWLSYNAGKYICNYSMYVICGLDVKFAFVHIPKDYGLGRAVRFIDGIIKNL